MKFIRSIARSRFCMPVCGVLALLAIVYIGFAIRGMVVKTPPSQRFFALPPLQEEQEIIQIMSESEHETYAAEEEIALPDAPLPEDSPTEHETAAAPEAETNPPVSTQKPTETTQPQTQKPEESITTKPPQATQKPAQTTKPEEYPKDNPEDNPQDKPASKPVNAWSVTYKEAKKMVKSDAAYDYEDLYWLSRVISAEAKGESFTGQLGVGTVVLNRVRSAEFPNTVKGVVFDRKYGTQFTPVANGTIYEQPTESAVIAAKMCLDGYTLSNSVLYFVNPRIATSSWIQNHRKYAFSVGNHDFYH